MGISKRGQQVRDWTRELLAANGEYAEQVLRAKGQTQWTKSTWLYSAGYNVEALLHLMRRDYDPTVTRRHLNRALDALVTAGEALSSKVEGAEALLYAYVDRDIEARFVATPIDALKARAALSRERMDEVARVLTRHGLRAVSAEGTMRPSVLGTPDGSFELPMSFMVHFPVSGIDPEETLLGNADLVDALYAIITRGVKAVA